MHENSDRGQVSRSTAVCVALAVVVLAVALPWPWQVSDPRDPLTSAALRLPLNVSRAGEGSCSVGIELIALKWLSSVEDMSDAMFACRVGQRRR